MTTTGDNALNNGEPISILVVDDEPEVATMVKLKLRRQIRSGKYRFTFASDGRDALEKLSEDAAIDMVLTDINMPRMDGIQLLRNLAAINPNLKSVVVSAYSDMRNIRAAMNHGAFDFVTKPLDFQDLETTIEKTIHQIAEQRRHEQNQNRLDELDSQITLAASLQKSILPGHFPSGPGWNTAGAMRPAKNVSGDFFDIFQLPDRSIAMVIADVSDKGIPAALYTMSAKALLKATATNLLKPANVLQELNNLLSYDNPNTMFVTLIYAVYNPESHTLTYANGGHCDPLLINNNGQSEFLPNTQGIALGLAPNLRYRQRQVQVPQGATIVAFTDGLTEAENPQGEQIGEEYIQETFQNNPPSTAQEALQRLNNRLDQFASGASHTDDATCVALHRN